MVCREDILSVLRTIDDPEMPISIVDLGLIERVEVERGAHVHIDLLPTFVGCHALPMMERDIRGKVSAIPGVAEVTVRFLFSPPWSVDRISEAGRAALKGFGVTVPRRPPEHIPGSSQLVELGTPRPAACPFCQSSHVRLESAFGPTRCRMIYYCEDCRNPFEHLKRV
ncbi:MAG: phenylacetate-CoA oxygenase subunit PaaJ [Phycisphaerales bacterium]|nr:phenylacetate-CoA oxygenase subunit PaaJ [Phycisphaerales bacterium]